MSVFSAAKDLNVVQTAGGENSEVRIDFGAGDQVAQIVFFRVSGTFVGTIKGQRSADGKTFADATVYKADSGASGNPTAVGVYTFLCTAADAAARIIFSAYTSGPAHVEVGHLPQSA